MQSLKLLRLGFLSLLLSLLFSGYSFAADTVEKGKGKEKAKEKPRTERSVSRLEKTLSLTEKQVEAVSIIYQNARTANLKSRKELSGGNKYSNYKQLAPDSKEYELGYKKAAELAAKSIKDRIYLEAESRKKIYALLDEEQKKKFIEFNIKNEKKKVGSKKQNSDLEKKDKNEGAKGKKAAVE